ncbi:putative OB-fold protein [Paenibacillus sp. V4I9]|nr:putative OB-fold protein [Paenibacillus sp. V4I9]
MDATKTGNKRMMPCKDCGNSISKKAEVCPHCGVRHNTHPVVFYNVIMIIIGLIIGFLIFVSRQ